MTDAAGPDPRIREACPEDVEAITALIVELGYKVTTPEVLERLLGMGAGGEPALVADEGGVIGCVTWHVTPVLHRSRPVGRITLLVVAQAERSRGLGPALVAAVEERLAIRGCGLIEVTSNLKREAAHRFYRRLAFEATSYRFGKFLEGTAD